MGPTLSGMYSYTTNCWLLPFLGDKFDSIIIRNTVANTQKNPLFPGPAMVKQISQQRSKPAWNRIHQFILVKEKTPKTKILSGSRWPQLQERISLATWPNTSRLSLLLAISQEYVTHTKALLFASPIQTCSWHMTVHDKSYRSKDWIHVLQFAKKSCDNK